MYYSIELSLLPPLQLSIWDTAGVERFRTLTRNYYRNAHAAVFVYSVAEASSLHYLTQWIKDTQNFAPNAIGMLIGNKSDLEPEIDATTAKSFAAAQEFELEYQTSCKTNSGISTAFDHLAKQLHRSATGHQGTVGGQGSTHPPELPSVDLETQPRKSNRGCRC